MAKQLFPYQQEALRALTTSHARVQRTLLSLPTGTGKTFTAAMYLKHACLDLGQTVVWIAHSEELLSQAYETFTEQIGIPRQRRAALRPASRVAQRSRRQGLAYEQSHR